MAATPTTTRIVLICLVVLALALVMLIVQPFAKALFVAAVLGGALSPACDRIERWFRGRRSLAAAFITLAVAFLLVLPLSAIATTVVIEICEGASFVRETIQNQGIDGLVRILPKAMQGPAQQSAAGLAGLDIGRALTVAKEGGAAALGGFFSATSNALLQTVLMFIALFFFLTDGRKLTEWMRRVSPIPDQMGELLADFRRVSVAVLLTAIASATAQTIVALIGFLIARVPHPMFFTLLAFVAAFIPVGGATLVGLGLALLLFATGHHAAAVFLAIWSVAAISMIDNVLKPLLMRMGVPLHGAVIFFSFLGGLSAFGLVGLIAGPIIVSFFLAVVRILRRGPPESAGDAQSTPQPPPQLRAQS
ncbi:MAG: AI-2E family transporter [Pseudomonadota bacterium]